MLTHVYNRIFHCDQPFPENVLRLDMAALPCVSAMERNGMRISRERIDELRVLLSSEMEELQGKINQTIGKTINVASGDQVADLLYRDLGLKQPGKERWTKSKTRLTVDSDVLKGMISQHPIVKLLLDYKERDKLLSTYTTSLIEQADENGYVHPDINHTGTDTGRYACNSPNLTNIPARTKLGKKVRSTFIPPDGEVFGVADMSQIEMRHAGEDAKCANLINVFARKEDLYWSVCEKVFRREFTPEEREHGVDPKSGLPNKKAFRQPAKIVALGTIYDISPEGLVDQLLAFDAISFLTDGEDKWDYNRHYRGAVERCTEAIRSFFDGYPELLVRRREHHRRAKKYGMVWNGWGRHRWIPQVQSCHNWIVGEGLRAAGNMPIQGFCAGVLKLWMAILYELIESYWGKYGIKPVIVVHDETDVTGPKAVVEDFLQEAAWVIKNLMPSSCYSTPLDSSIAIADDWGSVEK